MELVGFFKLSDGTADQKKTGNKIIALSKSVGVVPESADLKAFKANPRTWLHKAGYIYVGTGAGPNGEIPATVNIVPVFDTENTMHVRVPWKGVFVNPEVPKDDIYPTVEQDRFPVFLARYFMRKCR